MEFISKGIVRTPPVGCVSLSDKLIPICERTSEHKYNPNCSTSTDANSNSNSNKEKEEEPFAFTRSIVDVSKFKEKLENMPSEMWEVGLFFMILSI